MSKKRFFILRKVVSKTKNINWKVPAPMLKQRKLKRKWLKTSITCDNGVTRKFPRLIGVD